MSAQDDRAAFIAAAAAFNEAADKDLRREVYAAFRKAARPLAEQVIKDGSGEMPRRGGFGAKVAAAKISQSNATRGRNPGVALSFRTAVGVDGRGIDLGTVDERGTIRHPLFGDRKVWRVTNVRAGAFRRPFIAGRDSVAQEVIAAMQRVGQQIASRTNKGAR